MRWRILFTTGLVGLALAAGVAIGVFGLSFLQDSLFGGSVLPGSASDPDEEARPIAGEGVIAVVNLDEGIELDGRRESYASSIISELGPEYRLMPHQMAEAGMEVGSYDAMVSFPVDFSERVYSANRKHPSPAALDCTINTKLPEQDYLEVFQKLKNVQVETDNYLSYMYIYSFLLDFQSNQNKVSKVLANDDEDIEAATQMRSASFANQPLVSDVPVVELNLHVPEFDNVLAQAQETTDAIEEAAGEISIKMAEEYAAYLDKLTSEMAITTHNAALMADEVKTFHAVARSWYTHAMSAVDKYNARIEDHNNFTETYNSSVSQFYDYVALLTSSDYPRALLEYQDYLYQWRAELEQYALSMFPEDTPNVPQFAKGGEQLGTYIFSADTPSMDWLYAMRGILERPKIGTLPAGLSTPIEAFEPFPATISSIIGGGKPAQQPVRQEDSAVSDGPSGGAGMGDTASGSAITGGAVTDSVVTDGAVTGGSITSGAVTGESITSGAVTGGAVTDSASPQASTVLEAFTNSLREVSMAAFSYKPDAFIAGEIQEKVDYAVSELTNHVSTLGQELFTSQSDNMTQMQETYMSYSQHASDMQADVSARYQEDREQVSGTINAFVDTKLVTSTENRLLLGEFSDAMPFARMGAEVNHEYVTFLSNPVQIDPVPIRPKDATPEKTDPSLLDYWWLLLFAGVCLLIIVAAFIVRSMGAKPPDKDGT
ncbi:MAG: hypothetical protein LBD12_06065 [Clostridiales Family XIII bacterium]|jgi:hypothetical protein|nr:hypothetical protein [Clostridiales Family XIII bacterium]